MLNNKIKIGLISGLAISTCVHAAPEGYIDIPGTDTAISISGKAHVDIIFNTNATTNDTAMVPATIYEGNEEANISAEQSKISFQTITPSRKGNVVTRLEWDFFQSASSSAAPHLTHLWGEIGDHNKIGGGQTFSTFMDISVFPNTLEYWGPNSMVFIRQPQLRFTMGLGQDSHFAIALEDPNSYFQAYNNGSSEQKGISEIPDLTMNYRIEGDQGHFQAAAVLRQISAELANDKVESTVGWGINLSGIYKLTSASRLIGQFVIGEGISRYIDDTSVNTSDAHMINGSLDALPVYGVFAFVEHDWDDEFTSTFGWSYLDVDNANDSFISELSSSQYGIANLLWSYSEPVTIGVELQYGKAERLALAGRTESADNVRLQTSFIYKF